MNKKLLSPILLLGLPATAAIAQETKPNILWIVTDDQRADALACWNRATTGKSESALGYVSSPNIDKLASEGVLFTNSFCNSPVSAPSRASMHTGRYTHHNGIYDFVLAHNTNDNAEMIFPQVMREAGYKTTLFGKMGVRIYEYSKPMRFTDPKNPSIYDEKITMESDLERKGLADHWKKAVFDKDHPAGTVHEWYYPDGTSISYYVDRKDGQLSERDIECQDYFRKQQNIIVMPENPGAEILAGESPMPTERTLDGRIAEEFISYMENVDQSYNIINGRRVEGPKSSQPQFINIGFHFPHTPVLPSKEYRDQFLNREYKIPEVSEEELAKMPKQLKKWHEKYCSTTLSQEEQQQFIRDYYAFCAMGDKLVGEAVDKFKAYCAKNNQPYIIVIATGDHGWHLGEQGVTYKAANYVKSNQTAVIAVSSDKNLFPAGKVVTDFMEYVDFAPTFIAAAGFDLSDPRFDYLDGRDLVVTANQKVKPRDYVLGETSVSSGHRAYLRSKDFAFSMQNRDKIHRTEPNANIMWALECTPEEADMALFDLRVDPQERNNVAYDEEYKELANWFRQKLGNIVLGDGRMECDWSEQNVYNISNFAKGSDDKRLKIPKRFIPKM